MFEIKSKEKIFHESINKENKLIIFSYYYFFFVRTVFEKEIHMADNLLVEITGKHLEPLLSLISLNIRGNKILILPDEIALLPNLERLDVTNNDLAEYRNRLNQFLVIYILCAS